MEVLEMTYEEVESRQCFKTMPSTFSSFKQPFARMNCSVIKNCKTHAYGEHNLDEG